MNIHAVSTEEGDKRTVEVMINAITDEGYEANSYHWYNLKPDGNRLRAAATTSIDNEISSTKSECGDTTPCSSISTSSNGGKSDEKRANDYSSMSVSSSNSDEIQEMRDVMMQALTDSVELALTNSIDLVQSLSNAMSFTPANSFQSQKEIQAQLKS